MTAGVGAIASVASGSGTPALLKEMVARWRAAGIKVVGLTEEGHWLSGRTCNAGVLCDIASGARYSIYRDVPLNATSCHIDAAGAQAAGDAVLPQIATSDLVVLSKFGKLEAAGEGLAETFRAAVAARKPILTTVSSLHRDAWCTFMPTAVMLEGTIAALDAWWAGARSR